MMAKLKDKQVAATFVVGLVISFAVGALAGGNTGLTGMVSSGDDTVSPAPGPIIEKNVEDYIRALSGGQAEVEVVEMADAAIPGLKQATARVTVQGPNGPQTQEVTIITRDGKQAFMGQSINLEEPPQAPQQPAQPQQP